MNSLIIWIIGFTLLGGVLSVLAASSFMFLPAPIRSRMLPSLVSFATGALLGAAFLGLLPNALEHAQTPGAKAIAVTILLGVVVFFLLEKMVLWRHCHVDECEAHGPDIEASREKAAGNLILIGDSVHNTVDGVLIAGAFITDIRLGIVTSLAVIAHEIPQEVGDFAILLHSGFSRGKALFYNILVSISTVVGGLAAYFFLSFTQQAVPFVLAIAASSFIYIAVADLIPNLHKHIEVRDTVQQIVLISIGVAVIYVAQLIQQ